MEATETADWATVAAGFAAAVRGEPVMEEAGLAAAAAAARRRSGALATTAAGTRRGG